MALFFQSSKVICQVFWKILEMLTIILKIHRLIWSIRGMLLHTTLSQSVPHWQLNLICYIPSYSYVCTNQSRKCCFLLFVVHLALSHHLCWNVQVLHCHKFHFLLRFWGNSHGTELGSMPNSFNCLYLIFSLVFSSTGQQTSKTQFTLCWCGKAPISQVLILRSMTRQLLSTRIAQSFHKNKTWMLMKALTITPRWLYFKKRNEEICQVSCNICEILPAIFEKLIKI